MIIRTELWDRRRKLCKLYGFRAAIVYDQPQRNLDVFAAPACDHRLKVKEWLAKRYGQPMTQHYTKEWINTQSEWLAYRNQTDEYTIAVKDPKILNWLLLL